MDTDTLYTIKDLAVKDFPRRFHEEGPMFVEFVRAYYEWMESQDEVNYHTRRLSEYKDIDHTIDRFVVYFKEQYLKNIQLDTATDVTRLVKNSLDLYRSRGTQQGLDLFFKLVYGVDPTFYYPSKDIFRLSSGTWVVPTYLEVVYSASISSYVGKEVVGTVSGANAFVTSYVKRLVSTGKYIHVLYISNIQGSFQAGELLALTSDEPIESPVSVIGSLNTVAVTSGGTGFSLGDVVTFTSTNGQQAIARVSSLSVLYGVAIFDLIDGGYGYRANSSISVSGGSPSSPANAIIGSIVNTETINLNTDQLSTYAAVALGAADYGFGMAGHNANSSLSDALNFESVQIGEIGSIVVTAPGVEYLTSPTVVAAEPRISAHNKSDVQFLLSDPTADFSVGELVTQLATGARGRVRSWDGASRVLQIKRMNFDNKWVTTSNSSTTIVGTQSAASSNIVTVSVLSSPSMGINANISADIITSNSSVSTLEMIDSGFGYLEGEQLTFTSNTGANGIGVASISNYGISEGFYADSGGFLSDDKKLYDGWYYQDFSYQISSPISVERYADALKNLLHVSGTKYFSVIERRSTVSTDPSITASSRTSV